VDLCAEPIAGEARVHDGRREPETQRCGLVAHDWCATCHYNVCPSHVQSRHDHHTLTNLPMLEEETLPVHEDRRSGRERREHE
jgi:hypothetical protein